MPPYESTRIEAKKLAPIVTELIQRYGSPELVHDATGIGITTLYRIRHQYNKTVNQRTARILILALYERRKEDRRNGSNKRFLEAKKRQSTLEDKIDRMIGY